MNFHEKMSWRKVCVRQEAKSQSFPAMDAAEHSKNQGMPKGKPKQTKTNQAR